MRHKRNLLCFLMIGVMVFACLYTVYAATTSTTFPSLDGKTRASITCTTTWNVVSKDVGKSEMEILYHNGTDSRYSMTCAYAYKNGSLITSNTGYGYGTAKASVSANADEFRYKAFITQYANGGTGLGNTGWIIVTQ